ncbi:MAG TPA: hypothetical protein PKD61_31115, partial [Polyangiaceae bacterium]|nr:hypothetical protein [Polyangiaceae bacterium]
GPLGDRSFAILKKRRVPRATARLPVGYWSNSSGIDLAVLQLPLSDPGVAALVPTRNLGIQNSVQVIRTAMEGRQHLWGDTFQFDLISRECMKAVRDDHQRLEREAKLWRALAIAGAISFAWPLLNSPAATEGLSDMLLGSVKKAARDTAWSTLKQLLTGQQITDITWDDFGRLVLRHASQDPRLSQILLAGVSRLGLSDEQAAAILADVRQALGAQDASVSVMTRPNGPPTASVFLKNRGIELAADLLRTGRVRLDLNDLAALGQQLGLLQAARSALADPSTSTELVADVGYRGALTRVAEQLEAP